MDLLIVDNGVMKITLVPTRGMGLKEVKAADLRLGWDSPVRRWSTPPFIDLGAVAASAVDSFQRMLVRCGYGGRVIPGG